MIPENSIIEIVQETFNISSDITVDITQLSGRGSDRTFFRCTWNGDHSSIIILYETQREENAYYADILAFLHNIHIPVPTLFRHDGHYRLIIMEDLGDTDLWSFREESWEKRRTLYQKTLKAAFALHSFPEKDFPYLSVKLMDGFGPDLYRWEHNYFIERFVRDVCGIEVKGAFARGLEAELSALSGRLLAGTRSLVHRDFQSQNVMIRNGEPYFIDCQGMRFGNPLYDLGSLLCDPYMNLPEERKEELLAFYYGLTVRDTDMDTFRNLFHEASVQRLMQALGAYGFLGLSKNLRTFIRHIPAGLNQLALAASSLPSLSRLSELVQECKESVGNKIMD